MDVELHVHLTVTADRTGTSTSTSTSTGTGTSNRAGHNGVSEEVSNSSTSSISNSTNSNKPLTGNSCSHSHDHSHGHSHSHGLGDNRQGQSEGEGEGEGEGASDSYANSNNNNNNNNNKEAEEEEAEEHRHWHNVVRTVLLYETFMSYDIERRQRRIDALPDAQRAKLPNVTFEKHDLWAQAAQTNQFFFEELARFSCETTVQRIEDPRQRLFLDADGLPDRMKGDRIPRSEQHRNEAILHALYREWSSEGAEERRQCFGPILSALERYLPIPITGSEQLRGGESELELTETPRILVPGCGLARLPLEIAAKGYCCEGNEFSAYMVLASNFILNGISRERDFQISPWLDKTANLFSVEDALRCIEVPDIAACDVLSPNRTGAKMTAEGEGEADAESSSPPRFSFAAGDFVSIYGGERHAGKWDGFVSCFFIDTAPVVMEYIETVHSLLRPGGVWVNLGPLLFHWANDDLGNGDPRYNRSVELSWEEIRHAIEAYGFDVTEESAVDTTYSACKTLMMHSHYTAKFFVAVKR